MHKVLDKLDFQIALQSEEVNKSSTYWQKQCQMLSDLIRTNIPEVSVNPLSRISKDEEKIDIVYSYDILSLAGVTLNSFYILLRLINVWERNRKKANVKLRTENGSEFVLSNLSLEEAREIYRNLQEDNIVQNKTPSLEKREAGDGEENKKEISELGVYGEEAADAPKISDFLIRRELENKSNQRRKRGTGET